MSWPVINFCSSSALISGTKEHKFYRSFLEEGRFTIWFYYVGVSRWLQLHCSSNSKFWRNCFHFLLPASNFFILWLHRVKFEESRRKRGANLDSSRSSGHNVSLIDLINSCTSVYLLIVGLLFLCFRNFCPRDSWFPFLEYVYTKLNFSYRIKSTALVGSVTVNR